MKFGKYYELIIPKVGQPYVISNCEVHNIPGSTKTFHIDAYGYLRAQFVYANTKHKNKRLHQLVAEAVYGPKPEGMTVNHKDGNKLNNHPSNLEYATHAENIEHATRLGLMPSGIRSGKFKHGLSRTSAWNEYYGRPYHAKNKDRINKRHRDRYWQKKSQCVGDNDL